MVFFNVTGLKGQKLGYSLSHYLNLENAHICIEVLLTIFE
jgi:hypothetical protein